MLNNLFHYQYGNISLRQQAIPILESYEQLGIVLVIGDCNSGKTTLINKIKDPKMTTSQQSNKYINTYQINQNSLNINHPNCKLLIIELSDINFQNENNKKVISYLILISSIVVYNTKGNIADSHIHSLFSFVNRLKMSINQSEEVLYPTLFWILRDFKTSECFQLPKQYMEKSLELLSGSSNQQINLYKRNIKMALKDRQCYMFNHPNEQSQYSSFQRQISVFKQKILMRAKPLTINQQFMSGKLFVIYSKSLTKALQNIKLDNNPKLSIKSIHKQVRDIYNQQIMKHYKLQIQSSFKPKYNMQNTKQSLKQFKKSIQQNHLNSIKQQFMGTQKQYQMYYSCCVEYIEDEFHMLCNHNQELWLKYYQEMYLKYSTQYLSDIVSISQLAIKLQLIDKQIAKNQLRYQNYSIIIKSLQNKWIKENISSFVNNYLIKQKQQWQLKYNQIINYHVQTLELSQKQKQSLQSKISIQQSMINNKLSSIEQLQIKIVSLEQSLIDNQYNLKQKQNHISHLSTKFFKQKQTHTQQLSTLQSNLTLKNQQIFTLHDKIQSLQILIQNQQSKNKLKQLLIQKQQINRIRGQQLLQQTLNQKTKRIQNLLKQISKQDKLNQQYSKIKTQLRQKDRVIQNNQEFVNELKQHHQVQIKKLQVKINQYKTLLEEQDEIHKSNICSLRKSQKQIKELVQETNDNKQLIQSYQRNNKILKEELDRLRNKVNNNQLQIQNNIIKQLNQNKDNINYNQLNNKSNEQQQYKIQIIFKIIRVIIKQQNNKPWTLFEIQVNKQSKKWLIYKNYKEFRELHQTIKQLHQNEQISKYSFIVSPAELHGMKTPLTSIQRKKYLQNYINDLGQNRSIANSQTFREFITQKQLKQNKENIQKINKNIKY